MFKPVKLIPFLLSAALFVACSDDDEGDKSIVPDEQLPTEFSELTVEQNKEKLEENGLALVNDIRQLKDAEGVKTSISFSHFLSSAELPETGRTAGSLHPLDFIRSLAAFGEGKISVAQVLKSARTQETDPGTETDPQTAQELFDSNVGVFAYDVELNTWSHTPGNDGKIVFRFPSTKEGTENDAQFVIDGYTSQQVNNPELEYNGDLPTALKAALTVDGTQHIGYNLAASYKENGEPTSVETSLTVNAFKFSVKVTNTTQEVAAEYTLLHADKTLLSLGAGAGGNFSSSNISENEDNFGTVVQTAEGFFQIMNVRFAAEVNAQGLDNALKTTETVEQEADAWNANATMVVYYADSRKKIADTEFYGTTETEEYESCYDMNGDQVIGPDECDIYTYVDETLDIRLIFADNSTSDLETYTDVGFEDIQSEIEAIIDELETDLE